MDDLLVRRIHANVTDGKPQPTGTERRQASVGELRRIGSAARAAKPVSPAPSASQSTPKTAQTAEPGPEQKTADPAVLLDGSTTLPCPRDKVPMIHVKLSGGIRALFCATCRSTTALESPC